MTVSSSVRIDHSITIATWNADGLDKQKPQLIQFLKQHNVHVALIQETHFTNRIKDWRLPNYVTHRQDRVDRQKGGLLLAIKRDFPTRPIIIPPLRTLEALGVEILTPAIPIIVITT